MLPASLLLMSLAFLSGPTRASVATDTINDSVCKNFEKSEPDKTKWPAGCQTTDKKLIVGPNNQGTGYIPALVDGFIYAAGVVALIFLLIGAIRYITASGDSGRIKQAKDTVLYSIIGLIVVALAIPIADFVIAKLT